MTALHYRIDNVIVFSVGHKTAVAAVVVVAAAGFDLMYNES